MTALSLVKNYHEDKFPGWSPTRTYDELIEDPLHNELPFIELDFGWDTTEIYKELSSNENKDLWIPIQNSGRFLEKEWYEFEWHEGWMEIRIKGASPNDGTTTNATHKEKNRDFLFRSDALPRTQEFIESKNIKFTRLIALKLTPGGFAYPHRDEGKRESQEKNLECFWIPINHCNDNLKVYPYGYVPHKVGNMYLFNNKSYWHSIYNTNNHDRYVLTGRFDSEHSDFPIDMVKQSIKKFWFK